MKKNKQAPVEAYMVCDEGGSHNFQKTKEPSGCDKILCICCFPCYALCSCCLSEGAALANPFFEQICCSKPTPQEPDDEGKATCTKCGLNEREAMDLSDARENETSRGFRNAGYFSNAMSLPSAGITNQHQPGSGALPSSNDQNTDSNPPSPYLNSS